MRWPVVWSVGWPGLEPGLFDQEASARAMRPSRLHNWRRGSPNLKKQKQKQKNKTKQQQQQQQQKTLIVYTIAKKNLH